MFVHIVLLYGIYLTKIMVFSMLQNSCAFVYKNSRETSKLSEINQQFLTLLFYK